MKAQLLAIILGCSLCSQSQPLLKTTKFASKTYQSFSNTSTIWSEWKNTEATHRFTKIDAFGLLFRYEVTFVGGNSDYYKVSYAGYDADKNWFKYKMIGDEGMVYIQGVKMSYLSEKGWPDYSVQIYIYRKQYAFVFE